jgi:predicted transcriptional regulator
MAKAVLISIRPEWVEKIVRNEKTVEVRKTRPKLDTPFKCYIYCTQGNDARRLRGSWGKVIGEFVCDKITWLTHIGFSGLPGIRLAAVKNGRTIDASFDFSESCLTTPQIEKYLGGKDGYVWHISDLKIYDQPKKLNEFWFPPELYCEKERCGGCQYDQVADVNGEYSFDCEWKRPLTRPPQSWCYVEELQ